MTTLPQSWSRQEVLDAYGISPAQLRRLTSTQRVGFYLGAGKRQRFLPEHIEQLNSALPRQHAGREKPRGDIQIPGAADTGRRRKSA